MAYQYGQWDGFFVMTDDPREQARLEQWKASVKKRQQMDIADELSKLDKFEYGEEILAHLCELELKTLPDVFSIDIQTEIRWHMRPYLLDFLTEVHASFGLLPETLYQTVNVLDRYCSRRVVYKKHYQLVGCTALLIAAKYGEPVKKVPRIRELASMCCNMYDESMFIQMEQHVLTTLEWTVGAPTVDAFLQIAMDEGTYEVEVEHMALYISEIALLHREFVSILPSDIARSSLSLARIIMGQQQALPGDWAAQYNQQTLVSLSQHLHAPSKTLQQKYRSSHFSQVSLILDDFLARYSANRGAVAPPVPQQTVPAVSSQTTVHVGLQTPQKAAYGPQMPLTPPITPGGQSNHGQKRSLMVRESSPSPMQTSYLAPIQPQVRFYTPSALSTMP